MELATKGKKLLITTAIIVLAIEIIWTLVDFFIGWMGMLFWEGGTLALTGGALALMGGALRFILYLLLLIFVYKGHRWANIAAIIFAVIPIIHGLIDLVYWTNLFPLDDIDEMAYVALETAHVAAGVLTICVVLSGSVKAYQNHVKPSTTGSQPPMTYQPPMQYGSQAPMPYQPGQLSMPYQMAPAAPVTAMTPVIPTAPVPQPDTTWACTCGTVNQGRFCSECGQPKPAI